MHEPEVPAPLRLLDSASSLNMQDGPRRTFPASLPGMLAPISTPNPRLAGTCRLPAPSRPLASAISTTQPSAPLLRTHLTRRSPGPSAAHRRREPLELDWFAGAAAHSCRVLGTHVLPAVKPTPLQPPDRAYPILSPLFPALQTFTFGSHRTFSSFGTFSVCPSSRSCWICHSLHPGQDSHGHG